MKIVAVTNRKGGTGKTTTAVNLAASLAMADRSVLLVDWDPQGNATTSLGMQKQPSKEVFRIFDTRIANLSLLPADKSLGVFEEESVRTNRSWETLKKELFHVKHSYVIIDCAPSLNWLTINALVAASGVLIPMQCEFLPTKGLTQLLKILELLKLKNYPCLVKGIIFIMYDQRSRLSRFVEKEVKECFGEKVYETKIPRNVRLAEAPSHGLPGILYDPRSSGALSYMSLAAEFLRREELGQQKGSKI